MKKSIMIILTLVLTGMNAQEVKHVPQITVTGEGRIKVVPDRVEISLGVNNLGKDVGEVKKLNDETVDKVLKFKKNIDDLEVEKYIKKKLVSEKQLKKYYFFFIVKFKR